MLCHKTCEMKKLQMNVAHTIQNTQKFKFVSTRASDNSFGPMDFLEGHFQLAVVSGPDRPEARWCSRTSSDQCFLLTGLHWHTIATEVCFLKCLFVCFLNHTNVPEEMGLWFQITDHFTVTSLFCCLSAFLLLCLGLWAFTSFSSVLACGLFALLLCFGLYCCRLFAL